MFVKNQIFILLLLLLSQKLDAQFHMMVYNDLGRNNVSEGFYVKAALNADYQLVKYTFGYGNLFNLKNYNPNFLAGTKFNINRSIKIKDMNFDATVFFMYNIVSSLIHETNWGLALNNYSKHFRYMLGINYRTSHLTRKAIEDYEINSNTRFRENWNLMYLISYNIKPSVSVWNTGVTLTNTDSFLINQDTNPMIVLNARYKLQIPLTIFIETWYKPAGIFNISADSFGYFFRTGLRWEIS